MKYSVFRGEVQELRSASTIADGIAIKRPGALTYAHCSALVDDYVTVSESEIASAILLLLEEYKLVAEGAGAVAVAAAMYQKVDIRGKRAVCVLSGGNVDVNVIDRIINQGLYKTGRVMDVETLLDDRPRQLQGLLDCLSGAGVNVLSVAHDRDVTELGRVRVKLRLETRGQRHVAQVLAELEARGYRVKGW
jgi:threonine dehydratase